MKPLLLVLALLPLTTYAYNQTTLEQVGSSVGWHRLLLVGEKRPAHFFLSDGNPVHELSALLSAWQSGDERVCQFPARVHFAKEALHLDWSLPSCPVVDNWLDTMQSERLSVVFADEHPNHLPSGFGHTLLQADRANRPSLAINYTPNYTKDPAAVGAIKSLTGGYDGRLEILPLADKETDYLVKHERDIWRYTLDLSKDETAQVMRHLYEVKQINRPYYLTHDNCATEIVRLIDVVRPQMALRDKAGTIVTPIDLTKVLDEAGVITNTSYVPSKASLRQASKNNPSTPILTQPSSSGNPIYAPKASKVGIFYDDRYGVGLSYRTAYHDVLDPWVGVRKYLDVQVLDIKATLGDRPALHEATLFKMRSYNPKNSEKSYGKQAFGGHLGLVQGLDNQGDRHLVGHIGAELGQAWTLGQGAAGTTELADSLCYGLGQGAVQVGDIDKGYRLGLGVSAGCIQQYSQNLRYQTELSVPYWYSQGHSRTGYWLPKLSLSGQYDLGKGGMRAGISWQKPKDGKTQKSASIGYHRYF